MALQILLDIAIQSLFKHQASVFKRQEILLSDQILIF